MKFRTNRQRAERKSRKINEVIEKNKTKKQVHTTWHRFATFHEITQMGERKVIELVVRAKGKGKEKLVWVGRMLWSKGTYNRKLHGKLGE